MVTAPLVVAGTASVITGVAFLFVTHAVRQRDVPGALRSPNEAQATWWGGLGLYLILQGALTVAAGVDLLTAKVYLASRVVAIPLLCASVWGITSFLAYLYTGREVMLVILGVVYAAVALLFYWATFAGGAEELVVERWIVGVDDGVPLYRVAYFLVGIPPIVASLAYLALLPRLNRRQRYRATLVAGSILAYVGSGLGARLAASDLVIFVSLVVVGIASAAASLLAYYPPAPVRQWLQAGEAD